MPHRTAGRKLSRTHAHRLAMLGNLAVAIIRYEKVRTTEAKAKEVRGLVDGMITLAKRGDLHARRQLVSKMPHEPLIVEKLIGELAVRRPRVGARACQVGAASRGRRLDGRIDSSGRARSTPTGRIARRAAMRTGR